MAKRRFEGKVVWITGASSGIGEALARAFAREGAHLVLSARRKSELERVARDCGGARVDVVPFDLARVDEIPSTVEDVIRRVGRVDLMVHNAGISQRSLAMETSLEVDRRIMELNYFAVVALTKALLPHMIAVRGGRFVVVSSLAGRFGTKFRSAYAASKHALHGFFDALALEHADDGLGVTMVCPGYVNTNISANALRGDGSAHATVDASIAAGMSPDQAARIIVDGVAAGEALVLPAGKELAGYYLDRFAPGLLRKLLARMKTA